MEKKSKLFALAFVLSLCFPLTAGAQLQFVKYATRVVAAGMCYHRYADIQRRQIYMEIHRQCPVVRQALICPKVDFTPRLIWKDSSLITRPSVSMYNYKQSTKNYKSRGSYSRSRRHRRSRR